MTPFFPVITITEESRKSMSVISPNEPLMVTPFPRVPFSTSPNRFSRDASTTEKLHSFSFNLIKSSTGDFVKSVFKHGCEILRTGHD